MTKTFFAAIAFAAALAGATSSASAACLQSDAAGKWQSYSTSITVAGPYWLRCALTVSATGAISPATCFSSAGVTGNLSGGSVTLSNASKCTFTGTFTVSGVVNTLSHLTLAKNKAQAEGVGTFSGGIFTLSLTKL